MDIDPQTLKQTAPGVFGTLGALFLMRGPWAIRIGMVIPGIAASHYFFQDVARLSGMSEGAAGFTIGILGMIALSRIVDLWYTLDLKDLFAQILRKFGVKSD